MFLLFLANLFAFISVLEQLSADYATVQTFVIFAYLIISAMVLWGLSGSKRWSMASAAVLFFAYLVNAAILYQIAKGASLTVIIIVSLIGFLYCVKKVGHEERKSTEMVVEEVYAPKIPVKKYGTRAASKTKKSKKKKTAKKKSSRKVASKVKKKKSAKKKATKKKTTKKKVVKKKSSRRKTRKK